MSQEELFDINDPRFANFVPEEGNADADMQVPTFGPAADGHYRLFLRLRQPNEKNPKNPYVKAPEGEEPSLIFIAGVFLKDLEDKGRGYANDMYLSSKKARNQEIAQLHYVIRVATGKAVPANTPLPVLASLAQKAFDSAGESGIELYGATQWVRRIKDGVNPDGSIKWKDLKGQLRIEKYNIQEITERVRRADSGLTPAEQEAEIEKVRKSPWIYYNDEGKALETRVEVAGFLPRPVSA